MITRPNVISAGAAVAPTIFRVEEWQADHWQPIAVSLLLNRAAAAWHQAVTQPGCVRPVALRAVRPEGHVLLAVWRLLDTVRS